MPIRIMGVSIPLPLSLTQDEIAVLIKLRNKCIVEGVPDASYHYACNMLNDLKRGVVITFSVDGYSYGKLARLHIGSDTLSTFSIPCQLDYCSSPKEVTIHSVFVYKGYVVTPEIYYPVQLDRYRVLLKLANNGVSLRQRTEKVVLK